MKQGFKRKESVEMNTHWNRIFKERLDTQSYYIDKTQLIFNIIDEKWCCLLDIKYEYALLYLFLTLKNMDQSSIDQQIL